jgi:diguanylate cyclase (GGDEF)-like protein
VEFRVSISGGWKRWLRAQVMAECGAGRNPVRPLGITHDTAGRRQAEQQLAYLAYHDPLTGLANRRLLRQQLEQALQGARRGKSLALHFLDLDQFKDVNSTLGRPAGDILLCQAADRLRRCMRNHIVAHLGGDEFAVMQAGVQSPENAAVLARRAIAALSEVYDIEGQRVATSASVGIAMAPGDGTTPDELVRNADIALYGAKANGRATFRFFEHGMEKAVRTKQELKAELRGALGRDRLDLDFQPMIGLRAGGVACFEALLRWRHSVRGLVSPEEFVPVAEETGLIVPIGEWALRAACREAACWPLPIRVAVNLSPVQFRDPGLLRAVRGALQESGLAAERLELEITESVFLKNDGTNLAVLQELRSLGARIALDDFGTGYSSLGYLLRFPFNKIKLDRSFIVGLPDRAESRVIANAVATIGRSLGITIAAEGVETAGQLDALRSMGFDEAQGHLFSRPVPTADVATLIGQLRPSTVELSPPCGSGRLKDDAGTQFMPRRPSCMG